MLSPQAVTLRTANPYVLVSRHQTSTVKSSSLHVALALNLLGRHIITMYGLMHLTNLKSAWDVVPAPNPYQNLQERTPGVTLGMFFRQTSLRKSEPG